MHAHNHGEPNHQGSHISSAAAKSQRRLLLVLLLTAGYMLAEVAGGLFTNSLALLADAGHMLTDVAGIAMALAAIWFAQRPATPTKTYGFYRTEVFAAVANAVILFAVAGYVLVEAWQRFQAPPEVDSGPMLLVALGGLVVNLVGVSLLRAGSSESLNVQGAFMEVVADLLGTVGVILAAVVIHFTGWWQADPVVSVVIGLFILPRTWHLLKSALDVLLEATPAHIDTKALQEALEMVPGVGSVHDLHVWTITSGFVSMSAHVRAEGRRSKDVLHDVQQLLRQRFHIEHATLQVEKEDHADDGACCQVDPRCLVVGDRVLRSVAANS